MRLDAEVDGANAQLLDLIGDRVENMRPALTALGDVFRTRESREFDSAGGGSWAPDKPATVHGKGSSRVLVDEGGLLHSLTRQADRYAVQDVTDDSATFGTRNPVAKLLAGGARGMAVRNPVPATTEAERQAYGSALLGFLLNGTT